MTQFPVVVVTSFVVVGLVFLAAGWLIELETPKGRHTAQAIRVRADVYTQTIEVVRTRNSPPAAMMEEGTWTSTATAEPGCVAWITVPAASVSSTSVTAPAAAPSPTLAGTTTRNPGEHGPVRGAPVAVRPAPGRHRACDSPVRGPGAVVQLVDELVPSL